MTIDGNRSVDAIIVFVQYDWNELAKSFQSFFVNDLEKSLYSKLIEEMHKQLLALFVSHDFSESLKFILI